MAHNHGKLIRADLMPANVTAAAAQYNLIGKYTVKAGEIIFLGFGTSADMHNAVGRVYGVIKDNATPAVEIAGTWLLQIESAQDIPLQVIGTWRTEDWNTSATDKTKQIPWPKMQSGVSKDKKIALYFKPDTAATAVAADTTLAIDITRVLI